MIPIKYHLSEDLMPDKPTQLQLENAGKDPAAFHHIAVMPDVHAKAGRKCPTGTVLAAENQILPQVMDTAPNCGMRLMATPWSGDDLRKELIDEMFLNLVNAVPTRTYIGTKINRETAQDICQEGVKALLEHLGKDKEAIYNETQNMFKQGNFFDIPATEQEIADAVPSIFVTAAKYRLGILGEAGNHFLDLMQIDEVLDAEKAKLLGLHEKQYVFLMHTGSGIFGQYASYFFTPKKEEHLSMKIITNLGRMTFNSSLLSKEEMRKLQSEVKEFREKKEFFHIDPNSKRGKAYLIAHRASANYGFANRSMIAYNMEQVLKNMFNKKVELKTVYDMAHIFVDKEEHFDKEVWVHRNGASRGFGPSRMKNHPVFSQTGEPGIIAGSMSTPSYLVCGTDENNSTFYSINHGAGKSKTPAGDAPENKKELFEEMQKNEVKLYNAASKGVVQQAAKYYKDVGAIVKNIEEFNIAKPVVKMTPKAVLMA